MAAIGALAAAAQLCVPCTVPRAISESGCSTSCSVWSAKLQRGHVRRTPLLPRAGGLSSTTSWDGHLHLGHRQILYLFKVWDRRSTSTGYRGVVQATLLGVGAPEALVIAVVALIVFGPRGLAEVARTLGKSLRAFQPTIKELQQVSREFKNTLEQEIGFDELRNPSSYSTPPPPSPPAASPSTPPASSAPPAASASSAIPETLESLVGSSSHDSIVATEKTSDDLLPKEVSPQAVAERPQSSEPENDQFSGALKVVDEQLDAIRTKVQETVSEEDRLAAERAAWGGKTPGDFQAVTNSNAEGSAPESKSQQS